MTAIQAQPAAFLDLSGRTKLRVSGNDRLRFLNGQITNALHKATEAAAIEACVLNAKGRINAHIFVSGAPDCFFLDAEPELRETLSARLERYIIADDVQIQDITDRWSIFHVLSRTAPDLSNCRTVFVRRFLEPGWDVWAESATHDAVAQRLSSRFNLLDSSAAEVTRIEQGIPRWGRELTEEIIPIEANLEERTIDYDKGCYIGQEVISRMKMSGQTNKRLCGLISLHDFPLRADMKLAAASAKGKEAGWITSAARSDRIGKEIALSYAKRGFNNPGTRLEAIRLENTGQGIATPVEVVSLPFLKQCQESV
jgi:folate-binding protein YgfZ